MAISKKAGVHSWEDVLAQRYQNDKPSALPRYRRRKGSSRGPAPRGLDITREPDKQPQCLLLNKLPPELRLAIWEIVLGNLRLHIIQRSHKRLGCVICPEKGSCDICRGVLLQPVKNAETYSNTNLISLVVTCKLINVSFSNLFSLVSPPVVVFFWRHRYRESIHILYSANTFEFSNTWSLAYLRPTIPSNQWNAVRKVDLKWAFPGHWLPSKDSVKSVYVWAGRQQWIETCKAILLMANLEEFALHLTGNWFGEPIEKVPVFLEPLRDLRLRDYPQRKWKIYLPPQPYYKKETTRLNDLMQRENVCCEVHEAEQYARKYDKWACGGRILFN